MNIQTVETHFNRMGARVVVRDPTEIVSPRNLVNTQFRIDKLKDRRSEYFFLRYLPGRTRVQVLQVRPNDRHLLLLAHDLEEDRKDKYLCGHDEREWFVAAVPGAGVGTVAQAMEALKPEEVIGAQRYSRVRSRDRNRRHNLAFVRQGEWFFVPDETFEVAMISVLRNEPIRRGAGKPHLVEELVRSGGETVYVNTKHPNGITQEEFNELVSQKPQLARAGWSVMRRNMTVYARGAVRHPDHKTVHLPFWHRVLPNTEARTKAMEFMAFLD
jgi:hypothetical protein